MKNIIIDYSKSARKFLADNTNVLSFDEANEALAKAARKLLRYEDNNADVIALHGKLKGMYRLRKGNVRIVFTLRNGVAVVVAVEAIDFRGNIY